MKKVLKFGGTSVGSAQNMRAVADIIRSQSATLTVLSAMSGTTDILVSICDGQSGRQAVETLRHKYTACIDELLIDTTAAKQCVDSSLRLIDSSPNHNEILAQGELMTTFIFTEYLNQIGAQAQLINAPQYVHTHSDGTVDSSSLLGLNDVVNQSDTLYITQGFICTNSVGQLDNLGRGGSDYSAALMGVALGVDQVQIWTDIDGMHNGDPRYVEGTRPIRRMSFDQAAELAYFGAKILHPATILPCKEAGIDVRLKNTLDPSAEGTLIGASDQSAMTFHAVAAKDNITVVRITSARMLMAYGFLRRVFEVFEKYRTPIDMITTSEVAVSLTIDNTTCLDEILAELTELATVEVERDNTIVCVVGRMDYHQTGLASRIFKAIENIPIKMISFGASHRSLSLLICTKDKIPTLQSLNNSLF